MISSASFRSFMFLSFIEPIFGRNAVLILPIFLKRWLVFPLLLVSSISLHCVLSSIQLLVVADSLWPHKPQHARCSYLSQTLRVYSNLCPLNRWCHPTMSSSSFTSPPASIFPSLRVFSYESETYVRWPKYWSFSFKSVLPMNTQGMISFRMDWLDLLTIQCLSRVFSNTTFQKHQFFGTQLSL